MPGQTEVKQDKFVKFISRTKGNFRETYKSKNINTISPTPKFNLGRGVCEPNICYCVAAFMILFNMQNDHVLKKFNFDLLTSHLRVLGGVGGGVKRLSVKLLLPCY